jgi:hypothetical protein
MALISPSAGVSGSGRQAFINDPRWQLVERIIASPHLLKSSRLCGFLRFVTEETLAGRGEQLNEQRIGIHVFDRKLDYDSADDNIVRSHASRLRQRLEAYFLAEGRDETLRVELRRGSYKPNFEVVSTPLKQNQVSPIIENPVAQFTAGRSSASGPWPRYVSWSLVMCLLIVSVMAVYEWHNYRSLARSLQSKSAAARALWSQVFVAGKRNLIVPADSSLVLFENLTDKNVSLQSYISKDYLAGSSNGIPEDLAKRIGNRRLTSIADIELTSALLQIPEVVATHPQIRFTRDLQLADFKEANLILIGAEESDPWLSMFESRRNFVISNDQQTRVFTILNRSPHPGELPIYRYDPRDPQQSAYALIALRPNLSGNGNVLIVEGTGIAGTEAASDFLSSEDQIERVLAPALEKYGHIPPFEVLLETTNLNGGAPQSKVVAVRFGL